MKFLALALILLAVPALAQQSTSQVQADINATIAANGVNRITGPILNAILQEMLLSGTLASNITAGAFTNFNAPGLVKNTDLVNSSMLVNGTLCVLGGTCNPAGGGGGSYPAGLWAGVARTNSGLGNSLGGSL